MFNTSKKIQPGSVLQKKAQNKRFIVIKSAMMLAIAIVVTSVTVYVGRTSAQTWSEPSAGPPNPNIASPIWNQNTTAQAGNFWITGSGKFNGGILLNGSASGTMTIQPAATVTTPYTLTFPAAVGATGQVLQTTNSTGTFGWVTPAAGGGGTVTSSGTATYVPKFTTATNIGNSLIYDTGSAIGIGTQSPGGLLGIASGSSVDIYLSHTAPSIRFGDNDVIGSAVGYAGLGLVTAANQFVTGTVAGDLVLSSGSTGNLYLGTDLTNAAAGTARLTILNGGNVGINQTAPGSALDVKGAVRFSGATSGYMAFAVPATVTTSYTLTFPAAVGASGQVLQTTNGTGTLGWVTPAAGGGTVTTSGSPTNNYLSKFTSATAIGNSTVFDNGTSVGIGTATPSASYKLDVTGSINASANLCIAGVCKNTWPAGTGTVTSSGSATYIPVFTSGTNIGNSAIYQDASNRIGIGITTPATKLQVVGQAAIGQNTNGTAMIDAFGTYAYYGNNGVGAANGISIGGSGWVGVDVLPSAGYNLQVGGTIYASSYIYAAGAVYSNGYNVCQSNGVNCPSGSSQWTTNGSSIYYNGGNVGIGKTNPSSGLMVATGGLFVGLNDSESYYGAAPQGHIYIVQNDNGLMDLYAREGQGTITSTGSLSLQAASGGSINIGSSTSITGALSLSGTLNPGTGAAGYYQDAQNGAYRSQYASGGTITGYYFQSNSGGYTAMYVGLTGGYAGRVGINTTTPGYNLDVEGNLFSYYGLYARGFDQPLISVPGYASTQVLFNGWDGGGNYIQLSVAGNGANPAYFKMYGGGNATLNGVLTQNSDKRLKKNIVDLEPRFGLDAINALKPKTFNWNQDGMDTSLQTGFVAQDVQTVLPQLVKTGADGMLSLNYTGIIPSLVLSIQQQQKEIDDLKQQITDLKAR